MWQARYAYEASVALLRDKNSEGDTLRGSTLPEDVGNPVTQDPPRAIRHGSALHALMQEVGEDSLSLYDCEKRPQRHEPRPQPQTEP